MSMKEITPLLEFQDILKRWWMIVICVVVGGLAAWSYHFFQPPLYDARAVVVVDLDYAQTGKLDEIEQDQLVGAALALLGSTPVLKDTLVEIRAQNLPFAGFIYGNNYFMERRQSQLSLLVRDKDPELAAQVANLWLEKAYKALVTAHDYSLRAEAMRNYLTAMQECPTPPAIGENLPGLCDTVTITETQVAILSIETKIADDLLKSQGIIPAMTISKSKEATPPQVPIARGNSLLLFGGALAGFLLGVVITSALARKRNEG